jgi:hypothetical protein
MPAEHGELTAGDPAAATLLNLINWPALAIIAWHRGELASAERLGRTATLAWHRSLDLMGAADGVSSSSACSPPAASASAMPHGS